MLLTIKYTWDARIHRDIEIQSVSVHFIFKEAYILFIWILLDDYLSLENKISKGRDGQSHWLSSGPRRDSPDTWCLLEVKGYRVFTDLAADLFAHLFNPLMMGYGLWSPRHHVQRPKGTYIEWVCGYNRDEIKLKSGILILWLVVQSSY
jgi:hypothetical protein